jgi:hypothetical protein
MARSDLRSPSGPVVVGHLAPAVIGAIYDEWVEAGDRERHRGSRAAALRADARTALEWNAAYLAIGTPTQAQVVQQVRRLTQETSGLIRLLGTVVAELADLLDAEGEGP